MTAKSRLRNYLFLLILAFLIVIGQSVGLVLKSSESNGGEPFVQYTLFLTNGTLLSGNTPSSRNGNTGYFGDGSMAETETSSTFAPITVGGVPNGIAFDPLNGNLYVANFAPGTVSVISGSDNSVLTTLNLGYPVSPWDVGFNPYNGNVYVTDTKNGAVSVISGNNNSLVTTVAVGDDMLSGDHDDRPNGIVYNPNDQDMYVAMYGSGFLAEINSSTNKLIGNAPIGYDPYVNSGLWGLAYDSWNCYLYTSNVNTNTVTIVNGVTNSFVSMINVGRDPNGVAIDAASGPYYGDAFVANYASNTVSVISGSTNLVVDTINVGQNPDGISLDPATGDFYVTNFGDGTVSVINGVTNSVVNTIKVGSGPSGVAYDPWNGDMYVTDSNSATVSIIFTGYNSSSSSATTISTTEQLSSSCSATATSTSSLASSATTSASLGNTSSTSTTSSYSTSSANASSSSAVTTTLPTEDTTNAHSTFGGELLPLMIATATIAIVVISLFELKRHSRTGS